MSTFLELCDVVARPLPLLGLPLPEITITIYSSAGSGEEDCLGVEFSRETDSLLCYVSVVNNLEATPIITWMKGTKETSDSGNMLMYSLISNEEGAFTCEACVTMEAANIRDLCSQKTVEITRKSKYECTCVRACV